VLRSRTKNPDCTISGRPTSAKADASRLIGEKTKRKGRWAEWVRAELETLSPPEYVNMVRAEINRMMAANR
jgi:hypothetical protein